MPSPSPVSFPFHVRGHIESLGGLQVLLPRSEMSIDEALPTPCPAQMVLNSQEMSFIIIILKALPLVFTFSGEIPIQHLHLSVLAPAPGRGGPSHSASPTL